MDFGEALRRTMFEFRISGTRLAKDTGVNRSQISEFKNGNLSLSVPNLQKLIHGLDPEARAYFLSLVGDVFCSASPGSSQRVAEGSAPYNKN